MSIKIFTTTMALSLLLMLSGCDYKSSSQQAILNNEVITIEHEQGLTRVPINPKKVIVFNIATLDTMDALGIPVAGLPKTSSHLPNFLKNTKIKHMLMPVLCLSLITRSSMHSPLILLLLVAGQRMLMIN